MAAVSADMTTFSDPEQLLQSLYDAFAGRDPQPFADALADDCLVVGTDTGEWFDGVATFSDVLRAQFGQMHELGLRITGSGSPRVGSVGNGSWIADRATITMPSGDSMPLRVTMVLAEEDGRLRIKHQHVSLGGTNEAA